MYHLKKTWLNDGQMTVKLWASYCHITILIVTLCLLITSPLFSSLWEALRIRYCGPQSREYAKIYRAEGYSEATLTNSQKIQALLSPPFPLPLTSR
jgi:hypothetical protein